jgi:hypothetical protein
LAIAAVLATAMVGLAELTDVTTLDESFEAGAERVIDVQMTLATDAVIAVIVTAALGFWLARRGASRVTATLAAAAAPVLAAVLYPIVGMDLWNAEAAPVAAVVALVGALAAALSANPGLRRTPDPEVTPTPDTGPSGA